MQAVAAARASGEVLLEGSADEPRSLPAVFDRMGREVLGYLRALLGREDLAEDALQEAFVRLARRPGSLASAANVRAYVHRVARNEGLRLAARESSRRRRELAAGPRPLIVHAPDGAERAEEIARLEAALRRLPAEQREAVFLRCVEGFTYAEIGETAGITADTAASRCRYGMEKLRSMMGAANDD